MKPAKVRSKKKLARKALTAEQVNFPTIKQSDLARVITDKLNGDYFEHEVLDILEALGSSIHAILLKGYEVQIKDLGKFCIRTRQARKYWNVNANCWYQAQRSYNPQFEFKQLVSRGIKKELKELMVGTMQQPPDYPIDPRSQTIKDAEYLAKLFQRMQNRLVKYQLLEEQARHELMNVDELATRLLKLKKYKERLQIKFDMIKADIESRNK